MRSGINQNIYVDYVQAIRSIRNGKRKLPFMLQKFGLKGGGDSVWIILMQSLWATILGEARLISRAMQPLRKRGIAETEYVTAGEL